MWVSPNFASFADIQRVVRAAGEYEAFRYPVNSSSDRLLPHGVNFSLLKFVEKMDGLLDILDTASKHIWSKFQTEGIAHIGAER